MEREIEGKICLKITSEANYIFSTVDELVNFKNNLQESITTFIKSQNAMLLKEAEVDVYIPSYESRPKKVDNNG